MDTLTGLNFTWQKIDYSHIEKLAATRMQLHYAVQFIARAGKYLIEARPDDSHTSLTWDRDLEAFLGEKITSPKPVHIAVKPDTFELLIRDTQGNTLESHKLHDEDQDNILNWMKDRLANLGVKSNALSMELHYDIPDHQIAHGALFHFEIPESFSELAKYYSNAEEILQDINNQIPGSTPVRCWPHHFDIATLIILDKNKSPEESRSIGIGLSPGDATYNEPYFYITPWPYPDSSKKLPDLDGEGFWHTKGWTGAVLPATHIANKNNQKLNVQQFALSAINNCHRLLTS